MKSNNRIIEVAQADKCKKLAIKLSKKFLPTGIRTKHRDKKQSVSFAIDVDSHTIELLYDNRDTCQSFESGRTVSLTMYGTRKYCGGFTNFTKKTIKEFEETFTRACEIFSEEYKEQLKQFRVKKKYTTEYNKVVRLLKVQRKTIRDSYGDPKSIRVLGDTEVNIWNQADSDQPLKIRMELVGVDPKTAIEVAKVLRK